MSAGVVAATAIGLVAGALTGPVADQVAAARYAPGAPRHDPEDLALAPMAAPTTRPTRIALALLGAAVGALIASSIDEGVLAVPFAVVAWFGITASVVDLQYLRLPDVLTYGGAAAALASCVAVAVHHDLPAAGWGAVAGSLAYATFLLLALVLFRVVARRDGLGLGDVKLALALGAPLGLYAWTSALPVLGPVRAVIWSALLGSIASVVAAPLMTRMERGRAFPYGPSMVVGWLVAVALIDTVAP